MGPPERHRLTVVPQPSLVRPVRGRQGASPAGVAFLDLVESFCRLRVLEAWAELRSCLRADARLESIAARGVAGPEATIEAMRFATLGNVYTVREFEIEALDEAAALVRASISQKDKGVAVVTHALWLVTGCEGLIWRSRIVTTREVATRTLRDEGLGLGM